MLQDAAIIHHVADLSHLEVCFWTCAPRRLGNQDVLHKKFANPLTQVLPAQPCVLTIPFTFDTQTCRNCWPRATCTAAGNCELIVLKMPHTDASGNLWNGFQVQAQMVGNVEKKRTNSLAPFTVCRCDRSLLSRGGTRGDVMATRENLPACCTPAATTARLHSAAVQPASHAVYLHACSTNTSDTFTSVNSGVNPPLPASAIIIASARCMYV